MLRSLPLLFLVAGCGPAPEPPSVSPASPRVQAALAMVSVENRTDLGLLISFRDAGKARGMVSIGSVPAGSVRQLAPVPAAEPIVLSARTDAGRVLELPSRTFRLDEQWLWVIPAGTAFR